MSEYSNITAYVTNGKLERVTPEEQVKSAIKNTEDGKYTVFVIKTDVSVNALNLKAYLLPSNKTWADKKHKFAYKSLKFAINNGWITGFIFELEIPSKSDWTGTTLQGSDISWQDNITPNITGGSCQVSKSEILTVKEWDLTLSNVHLLPGEIINIAHSYYFSNTLSRATREARYHALSLASITAKRAHLTIPNALLYDVVIYGDEITLITDIMATDWCIYDVDDSVFVLTDTQEASEFNKTKDTPEKPVINDIIKILPYDIEITPTPTWYNAVIASGIIKVIDIFQNTATVQIGNAIYGGIPFYFHCLDGTLNKGGRAFRPDDNVLLLINRETKTESINSLNTKILSLISNYIRTCLNAGIFYTLATGLRCISTNNSRVFVPFSIVGTSAITSDLQLTTKPDYVAGQSYKDWRNEDVIVSWAWGTSCRYTYLAGTDMYIYINGIRTVLAPGVVLAAAVKDGKIYVAIYSPYNPPALYWKNLSDSLPWNLIPMYGAAVTTVINIVPCAFNASVNQIVSCAGGVKLLGSFTTTSITWVETVEYSISQNFDPYPVLPANQTWIATYSKLICCDFAGDNYVHLTKTGEFTGFRPSDEVYVAYTSSENIGEYYYPPLGADYYYSKGELTYTWKEYINGMLLTNGRYYTEHICDPMKSDPPSKQNYSNYHTESTTITALLYIDLRDQSLIATQTIQYLYSQTKSFTLWTAYNGYDNQYSSSFTATNKKNNTTIKSYSDSQSLTPSESDHPQHHNNDADPRLDYFQRDGIVVIPDYIYRGDVISLIPVIPPYDSIIESSASVSATITPDNVQILCWNQSTDPNDIYVSPALPGASPSGASATRISIF